MSNSLFEGATQLDEITQKAVEDLLKDVEQINPALGGFEEIAALLSLPDEQFSLIAAVFLDEMEKSLSGSNEKFALVQMMKSQGLTAETMNSVVREAFTKIESEMGGRISQIKIDFLKNMLGVVLNVLSESEDPSNHIVSIPLEKVREDAIVPTYAYKTDAGMDVYAAEEVTIQPGETAKIPLGFKVAIPKGYYLQLCNKSGICAKTKLRIANAVGVIDSDYRGEVCALVENIEPPIKDITYDFGEDGKPQITSILHGLSYTIEKGQKVGQLILAETPRISFFEGYVDKTERNEGGFGSTGLTNG